MHLLYRLLAVVVVLALAVAGFYLWARQREIPPAVAPSAQDFDRALIEHGAQLAALGNCRECHTTPGGPAYAGGRPLPTPFGTIYSTNITPDPDTGIGTWSEAAFERAMLKGVSRRGDYLYPAFPYTHFAKLADGDLSSLYAYFMTRTPVRSTPPPNKLAFPFNIRWLMAGWNLLFLDDRPFQPDPDRSDLWNRGAFLVTGVAHCGMCHTPRDLFGAETATQAFSGGEAEGWTAPALNAESETPVPWDTQHLFDYLHQGWDIQHGAAAGPMQSVTESLRHIKDQDIRAIATYIASLQEPVSRARKDHAEALLVQASRPVARVAGSSDDLGATIYAGACARCHAEGPAMVSPRGIDLRLSTALASSDPTDAILIILNGIRPPDAEAGPFMPSFRGAFNDSQLTALLSYLRMRHVGLPSWADLETRVRQARERTEQP